MVEDTINTIVGAFARVDPDQEGSVRADIDALSQVSTFDLDGPGKLGLLIEAGDLDEAHGILTQTIGKLKGVWGVWPVYAHNETDQEEKE